ncbi:MAG: hypothetical protein QOF61_1520 [Acidobacteriota bacterium]|jgi:hypothetical protein|nr:hypothetical protein [Acidobacteriota bacterium]
MFKNRLLAASLSVTLLVVAIVAPGRAAAQGTGEHNNWTWNRSDDGKKIEVKVENKVEFNEEYSDVSDIPADGALRIHDSRGADTFRLVVTRGAGGGLERDYSVNGARRDFDARAQGWLREVLLLATRQGGLDARNRVGRILARGGTRAVVEEIAHIEGDYARRIYFDELLKIGNMRDEELRDAIGNASRSIRSDYERAQLLLHVSDVFLAKDTLVPPFFEALSRIGSDYEHHRVLSGALKRTDLSREALVSLARSTAAIGSDYEKASFLIEAASRYQVDERLREAFRQAMQTIGSDYERGRVQTKLTKMNY